MLQDVRIVERIESETCGLVTPDRSSFVVKTNFSDSRFNRSRIVSENRIVNENRIFSENRIFNESLWNE